jgi:sulfur-oxidizing protein SoxY
MNRRGALTMIGSQVAITLLPLVGQTGGQDVESVIKEVFGERPLQPGRITLELPKLAESGNSVPLSVAVESPMSSSDRVLRACIFATQNPRPLIVTVTFGPNAGRAAFSTNFRLNGTQDVIAIAEMSDRSLWTTRARVLVTIGACDALQSRY